MIFPVATSRAANSVVVPCTLVIVALAGQGAAIGQLQTALRARSKAWIECFSSAHSTMAFAPTELSKSRCNVIGERQHASSTLRSSRESLLLLRAASAKEHQGFLQSE